MPLLVLQIGTDDVLAGWREQGIMAFNGGRASELWAGRLSPSRHNTSSPDLVFGVFSEEATGKPAGK